jgi:hypothetical protein
VSGVVCANHPDRPALWYCAGCGRPLCSGCVVRLAAGNYCPTCAESPGHRPRAARARRPRTWLWVGLAAAAVLLFLLSRTL